MGLAVSLAAEEPRRRVLCGEPAVSKDQPDRNRNAVEEGGYRPIAEGYRPTSPNPKEIPPPPTSSGGASEKE